MSKVKTSREGGVMTIMLASPETLNSLDLEIREDLGAAVEEAERDKTVRAVFFGGEGRAFCAGGNFKLMVDSSDAWSTHRRFRRLSRWLVPLLSLDKPVVVGMRGQAVGGGMGMALCGDLIVAGEGAKFIAGWFRLGAVPDIGVLYNLPRLIGMARAKNFLFGKGEMSAAEAFDVGIVHRLVPDDRVDEAAFEEARRLADGPAEVMGLSKTLLNRAFETTLADMVSFEGFGQALAMANPEFAEGLAAALAKRRPDFQRAAAAAAQPARKDKQ
ncbi:MAG TPA: enoyl-CoA hydratase/isomerase family protein [Burkholderiaceae bacterium]|nr:enoyl-CoA hydratase/isomerase family protein [Burkholderiaceae bacterium]